jgi:hypothetical protein
VAVGQAAAHAMELFKQERHNSFQEGGKEAGKVAAFAIAQQLGQGEGGCAAHIAPWAGRGGG